MISYLLTSGVDATSEGSQIRGSASLFHTWPLKLLRSASPYCCLLTNILNNATSQSRASSSVRPHLFTPVIEQFYPLISLRSTLFTFCAALFSETFGFCVLCFKAVSAVSGTLWSLSNPILNQSFWWYKLSSKSLLVRSMIVSRVTVGTPW